MTGSGTLLDPYIIYDVNDLQAMENDLAAYYELANDIDASATVGWEGGLGFDPIGTYKSGQPQLAFRGNFDGKGYKITDLFINRPTEEYVALFGYTGLVGGYGGDMREMKNVGIEDCDITGKDYSIGGLVGFHNHSRTITDCWVTGQVKSDSSAPVLMGGLAGYADGVITRCHFSGDISIGTTWTFGLFGQNGGLIGLLGGGDGISDCYSTGTFIGHSTEDCEIIGGLVGYNTGAPITRCYSTMDLDLEGDNIYGIGGLIGENAYPITDCYCRGEVKVNGTLGGNGYVGGFVGYNDSAITNCYSTGEIITNQVNFIGGFCGGNFGTITDCFWDTQTSGTATSDGGTGKTTAQMKKYKTFTGWGFGTIWGITNACNDGYPCLLDVTASCKWAPYKGNIHIDQLIYQHAERMVR